jgi:hypothetical protein
MDRIEKDDERAPRALTERDEVNKNETARTIAGFCRCKNFSLSTYFKIRREGNGPDEDRVPGTKIVRISPEAERAWDQKMRALAREEAAKLEAERRRAQASAAGKQAAAAAKLAAAAARPPQKSAARRVPKQERSSGPVLRRGRQQP